MKLLFVSVILFVSVVSTEVLNAYIGECYLTSNTSVDSSLRHDDGNTLNLVCVNSFRQTDLFGDSPTSRCSKSSGFVKSQIIQINFENCSLTNIGYGIFEVYKNLTNLNATYLGLEHLQKQFFNEAKNLTNLDVSHNKLIELPSFLFLNAGKLRVADFSFNQIHRMDSFTFTGELKLEKLNLAQNNIATLDKMLFDYLLNLKHLNLSNNSIHDLNEHTFDNLTHLEVLDLSFNPIEKLSTETFTSLVKLKYLNLSHTQLSTIKSKTFCRLENLEILDLSHNHLKILDVRMLDSGIFLPRFDHLKGLLIEGNQLTELDGFTSEQFPALKIHGIPDNKFDCCYLAKLFRSIGWKQLELPFDENSNHPNLTDATGARCIFGGEFLYFEDTTNFSWAEALSVVCFLFVLLLFVMVGAIMKTNNRYQSATSLDHNMTVHCDSISNFDYPNVYDVPKF
ncbi:chaoptin-like [Contarinia nasturtii]|uniref:chaoptin-like n=1 Tax=Contarinia nasturtii TaxID=265458 RepID=UPI0012D4C229|nr:chaoptin-like [Contarinia nasturtii]